MNSASCPSSGPAANCSSTCSPTATSGAPRSSPPTSRSPNGSRSSATRSSPPRCSTALATTLTSSPPAVSLTGPGTRSQQPRRRSRQEVRPSNHRRERPRPPPSGLVLDRSTGLVQERSKQGDGIAAGSRSWTTDGCGASTNPARPVAQRSPRSLTPPSRPTHRATRQPRPAPQVRHPGAFLCIDM